MACIPNHATACSINVIHDLLEQEAQGILLLQAAPPAWERNIYSSMLWHAAWWKPCSHSNGKSAAFRHILLMSFKAGATDGMAV